MRLEAGRRTRQHVDVPHQHVDAPVTAEHLHGLIRAVELHCRRGMDRELGQIGLSMVQWQALRLVSRHPGIRQRRLARLTGHSGQAFAMLLARMIRYDFVGRRAGRGQPATHELTRLGHILLPMADEIVADAQAQLFDRLDVSERAALKRLLSRVLHASSKPPWYNTG
jgi:DNA-binding MarR family transcriptional regulator